MQCDFVPRRMADARLRVSRHPRRITDIQAASAVFVPCRSLRVERGAHVFDTNDNTLDDDYTGAKVEISSVPLHAAGWLLLSALFCLSGIRLRHSCQAAGGGGGAARGGRPPGGG